MNDEMTLDEIIAFYELVGEVQKALDSESDNTGEMDRFGECAEKYQRQTDRFDDDER